MADEKKRIPFADRLRTSLIVSALSRLADIIYDFASSSITGKILTSYDRCSESAGESLTSAVAEKLGPGDRIIRPLKRFCIKSFENSLVLKWISSKLRGFFGCSMRYYGTFLLSFGVYSASIFGIKYYMNGSASAVDLVVALMAAVFSIPLMLTSMPLSEVVCSSRILRGLLFKVIGVRRENIENTSVIQSKPSVAFIAGMLLGLSTYMASPGLILGGLLGIVVLYTILVIPESGVVLIIFTAPFMAVLPRPSILTALMVLYVTGCYFLKLIRGKRTFRFELIDGAVMLFLLLTLLGGIFTVSVSASLEYALIYSCFMISYFLVVNLIRTDKWVHRCVAAFICSSAVVSLYGVYQNLLGTASTKWQDQDMFTGMGGRVVSTFENPNVLAEYLIITIPFALAVLLTRRGWTSRGGMFVVCGLGMACLVFTLSRGAWLGFMIGMLVFFLIYSRKTMVALLLGLFSVPILPFIMPENIVKRFTSIGNLADSSTAYRVNIWNGSVDMIRDFLWGGIGTGREAFTLVYPSYTLAGIESAPHSHNLYLQIMIELGIFGLLAFFIVVFFLAQNSFSFFSVRKKLGQEFEDSRLLCAAGFSGITAIMAQGMTDYIWYNYRIYLIFWLVLGLTVAIRRSALAAYVGDRYDDICDCNEKVTANDSDNYESVIIYSEEERKNI
ncbi:MAG: O-antigen ligase family protein [Eubacteriales bacterium]